MWGNPPRNRDNIETPQRKKYVTVLASNKSWSHGQQRNLYFNLVACNKENSNCVYLWYHHHWRSYKQHLCCIMTVKWILRTFSSSNHKKTNLNGCFFWKRVKNTANICNCWAYADVSLPWRSQISLHMSCQWSLQLLLHCKRQHSTFRTSVIQLSWYSEQRKIYTLIVNRIMHSGVCPTSEIMKTNYQLEINK